MKGFGLKKVVLFFVLIFLISTGNFSFSQETQEAGMMAKKFHKIQEEMLTKPDLVTPDSIYTTAELKAIYYQNVQIIELLKEIRDTLRISLKETD